MPSPVDEEVTTSAEKIDEEVTAPSKNKKQAPLEKFLVSNKNAEKIQRGRRATCRVQNAKAAESNNMPVDLPPPWAIEGGASSGQGERGRKGSVQVRIYWRWGEEKGCLCPTSNRK